MKKARASARASVGQNQSGRTIGQLTPDAQGSTDFSWEYWQTQIAAAWRKGVASIVETAQILIDAQANLEHGAWESMVQHKLPFTPRTARMLMAIAGHPAISNRKHVSVLPPSWGTLYQLSWLPPADLEARIEDGTITPRLERRESARLVKPPLRQTGRAKSQPKCEPVADTVRALEQLLGDSLRKLMGWKKQLALIEALREVLGRAAQSVSHNPPPRKKDPPSQQRAEMISEALGGRDA